MSHGDGKFYKDLHEQPLSNPNYKHRCWNEVHMHLTNELLVSVTYRQMKDKWKHDSPTGLPDLFWGKSHLLRFWNQKEPKKSHYQKIFWNNQSIKLS